MWSLATIGHVMAYVVIAAIIALIVISLLLQHVPWLLLMVIYTLILATLIVLMLAIFFRHTCSLCPPRHEDEGTTERKANRSPATTIASIVGVIGSVALMSTGAYVGSQNGYVR